MWRRFLIWRGAQWNSSWRMTPVSYGSLAELNPKTLYTNPNVSFAVVTVPGGAIYPGGVTAGELVAAPVPLPPSVLLLGSGLIGLAALGLEAVQEELSKFSISRQIIKAGSAMALPFLFYEGDYLATSAISLKIKVGEAMLGLAKTFAMIFMRASIPGIRSFPFQVLWEVF